MASRILVVDDEENIRYTFASFLKDEGLIVDVACSIEECRQALSVRDFDLVYLDILLGGDSGIDALRICKEMNPACPVVMVTGSPDLDTATDA
ncbi:MAG: response regulator, partial [Desulfuromonadales bacterium]|nr:response regulator [Desulfuromonadales bacterium]